MPDALTRFWNQALADWPICRAPEDGRTCTTLVSLRGDLCMREGKPFTPCRLCSDACPAAAISLTQADALRVSSACIGCGACAAQCPTGALSVSGFERASASAPLVAIECARVPAGDLRPHCWVTPCANGLRVSDIVAAAEASNETRIEFVLIDRGLCRACPSSRQANVIDEVHAKLSRALSSLPSSFIGIRRESRALDPAQARPAGARPATSRRALLRAWMQASIGRENRGVRGDRAALARVAARNGDRLSAWHYPSITIGPACRDHGVCSASCPTGALRVEALADGADGWQLVFDAGACVECGRCAEVCPNRALTLTLHGEDIPLETPVILRQRAFAICLKCEDRFVIDGDDAELCPACRKSESLFVDLFAAARQPTGAPRSSCTGAMV